MISISLLYHGTISKYAANIISNGVILDKSKKHLDFGPGFYTTPNMEFALETAKCRAKSYNAFHKNDLVIPKVLVFEYMDTKLSDVNIKMFDVASDEWAQFVLSNRTSNDLAHEKFDNNLDKKYDIVHGPTADGKYKITPTVNQIDNGCLSIDEINYRIIAPSNNKKWGDQISFHTEDALACIKLCGAI